jgi:hypothetical protein
MCCFQKHITCFVKTARGGLEARQDYRWKTRRARISEGGKKSLMDIGQREI